MRRRLLMTMKKALQALKKLLPGLVGVACFVIATVTLAHPGSAEQLAAINADLSASPDAQALYRRRGIIYSSDGQFDQALDDFRKAETLGDPVIVAFDLGVLFYRKGDFARARSYFGTTLRHFPHHPPALEYRARVLRDAGDYAASLADFTAFFALQPHPNPGHFISAATMLAQGDDKSIQLALHMLDQGMNQLGLAPQLQRYAIELELQRGRDDNAITRLSSLEPMLGNSPVWKVQMGELLLATGATEEAQVYLCAASAQLNTLRKNPAREQLQVRISRLK